MPAINETSIFSWLGDDDLWYPVYPSVYTLNGLVHVNERHSLDNNSLYEPPSELQKLSFRAEFEGPSLCSKRLWKPAARSRHRSLVDTAIICDEMSAAGTRDLSSPPGLTDSNSSSFHSSSLSDADSAISDTTHFEDISLDKEVSVRRKSNSNENAKTVLSIMNGGPKSASATAPLRELTLGDRRQSAPAMNGARKSHPSFGPPQGLVLPKGAESRRSFQTSSSSSLARRAMSNHSRSRSPSPSPSATFNPPMLPKSATLNTLSLTPDWSNVRPPMKSAPVRRSSWTPSRKTAKELEKEFDDLDEELPEDASLWNVPLSPRPPSREKMITPANYPLSSSPERNSPRVPPSRSQTIVVPPTPRGIPPGIVSPAISDTLDSAPSSPMKPKFQRVMSTGTMADDRPFAKSRAKSWTVAMSELSEEAKDLTTALESFADESGRKQEENVQRGDQSRKLSMDIQASITPSFELPPLRTNNVMIDPLPISKEKEKVLSRTRPSWLPPKSQKEEKKHLKEYRRMMEMSLQAEKRKAANLATVQCAKDDTENTLQRLWEEHVLPDWDRVVREPRTRELWWKGVAPRSRAQVWERAIGNELALSASTFEKALQRSRDLKISLSKSSERELCKERLWFEAIDRDIKATLPELKIFQPGSSLHDDLADVLKAYCMYRSDVGYCHGTHLIAALLVLTFPTPSRAFLTLANLLNRPLPLAFLTGDPTAMARTYQLIDALLARKYPKLYGHLFTPEPSGLGLSPHELFEPMMRTLFLGPGGGFGVEVATRVWDVMVFEGDRMCIRTAVAVLGALEGRLYGETEEVLNILGWGGGGWKVGNEEGFMSRVKAVGKTEKGVS